MVSFNAGEPTCATASLWQANAASRIVAVTLTDIVIELLSKYTRGMK